ncbi:hypothetical protein L195_g051622, partial [Trifolium pratense]
VLFKRLRFEGLRDRNETIWGFEGYEIWGKRERESQQHKQQWMSGMKDGARKAVGQDARWRAARQEAFLRAARRRDLGF